jgi:hypothetical protein
MSLPLIQGILLSRLQRATGLSLRYVSLIGARSEHRTRDQNALRAEVGGLLVGYLRRHIAAQVASALDRFGCSEFSVAGSSAEANRTPTTSAFTFGSKRRTTAGPEFSFLDQAGEVA